MSEDDIDVDGGMDIDGGAGTDDDSVSDYRSEDGSIFTSSGESESHLALSHAASSGLRSSHPSFASGTIDIDYVDMSTDIARTLDRDSMRVQENGRERYRRIYYRPESGSTGSSVTTDKTSSSGSNQPYAAESDRPPVFLGGQIIELPGVLEFTPFPGATEFMAAGLMLGNDPEKLVPKAEGGPSQTKEKNAERRARGIMDRHESVTQVLIRATEKVPKSFRYYALCWTDNGGCYLKLGNTKCTFFYDEFWDGVHDKMNKGDRERKINMNCKVAAARNRDTSHLFTATSATNSQDRSPTSPSGGSMTQLEERNEELAERNKELAERNKELAERNERLELDLEDERESHKRVQARNEKQMGVIERLQADVEENERRSKRVHVERQEESAKLQAMLEEQVRVTGRIQVRSDEQAHTIQQFRTKFDQQKRQFEKEAEETKKRCHVEFQDDKALLQASYEEERRQTKRLRVDRDGEKTSRQRVEAERDQEVERRQQLEVEVEQKNESLRRLCGI